MAFTPFDFSYSFPGRNSQRSERTVIENLVRTDDYIASRAFLIMDLICLYPLVDPASADRSEKGRFIWSQHVNFGITLGTPHTDGLSGWSPNNEKLVRFARDSSGFFLLQLSLRVANDERPSILPTLLLLVSPCLRMQTLFPRSELAVRATSTAQSARSL